MFSLLAALFIGVSLCGYLSGNQTKSAPMAAAMAGSFIFASATAFLLWSAKVAEPLFFVGIMLVWSFSGAYSLGWAGRRRKGSSEQNALEVRR